jgi:D-amino-acid dehydrogenase
VPGFPGKALLQLPRRHSNWRLGRLAMLDAPWLWRRWRASQAGPLQANRQRLYQLAQFSQARLQHLSHRLLLDYERQQGQLILLRNEHDLKLLQPGLKALDEWAEPYAVLDAAAARLIEPALNPETPLHAALQLPTSEVSNCRQFAHLLKGEAQARGVQFRFRHEVVSLEAGAPVTVRVRPCGTPDTQNPADTQASLADSGMIETGPQTYDAVVVCAATGSVGLLSPLGLKLPLASVAGYSITAPLRVADSQHDTCPRSGVLDERYRVTVSRMGNRIRVAGGLELGRRATGLHEPALATLYKVLDDWFPAAARTARATQWRGVRAMLPDGPPVLGPTAAMGIFVNLGHGSSGWALSCGSARVLADLVGGRTPTLDVQGLGLERLG